MMDVHDKGTRIVARLSEPLDEQERIIVHIPDRMSQQQIEEIRNAVDEWRKSGVALIIPESITIARFHRPPHVQLRIGKEDSSHTWMYISGLTMTSMAGFASLILAVRNPDMTAVRLWMTYPILLVALCVIAISGIVIIGAASQKEPS